MTNLLAFVHMFALPLGCFACALAGAVLAIGFRDDAPRTDRPREEHRWDS